VVGTSIGSASRTATRAGKAAVVRTTTPPAKFIHPKKTSILHPSKRFVRAQVSNIFLSKSYTTIPIPFAKILLNNPAWIPA